MTYFDFRTWSTGDNMDNDSMDETPFPPEEKKEKSEVELLQEQYTQLLACHQMTKTLLFYFAGITVGLLLGSIFLRGD
jgi:hypothetical protein